MTYHPEQNPILALLHGAHTRILDVVDAQYDFMNEQGALSVNPRYGAQEDASEIIEPMNAFFKALPDGAFNICVIKFDTHFINEYAKSPEAALFPNPHCLYGTLGWNLAVDTAPLTEKFFTYMMAKNEFDMWGSNPTGIKRTEIAFEGDEEKAYDNLFKFVRLHPGEEPAKRLTETEHVFDRDNFIKGRVDRYSVVVLCGVASDFCNYQAMMGYLKLGATVIIADDLTRGIGGSGSAAPETGTSRDVVKAALAANPDYEDKLFMARSDEILASLNELSAKPTLPKKHIASKAPLQVHTL